MSRQVRSFLPSLKFEVPALHRSQSLAMLGKLYFTLGSLAWLCASTCALHIPRQEAAGDAPRQTSFGNGAVSFDEHSLSLFGQRIFLQ